MCLHGLRLMSTCHGELLQNVASFSVSYFMSVGKLSGNCFLLRFYKTDLRCSNYGLYRGTCFGHCWLIVGPLRCQY